jgi:DNA polymerase-1
MSRLIVLDALGLVYRAYYAMVRFGTDADGNRTTQPTLWTSRKEPSNAIFGMAGIVTKLRREQAPDLWALAWDGPGPTFRHEMYPEYKAHRPAMPADLASQLSPIEELAQCLGLPVIEKPGMEADDVMATLARLGAEAGHDVVLVTGDKDMLQVVNERVSVLVPQGRGDEYVLMNPDAVRAKWGVGPEGIRDVLALMGDSSDNIPGVPGVGEKTAVELMKTFGTLDAIYDRIEEIKKPALKRKLGENKALAYLSRELATVRADLDLGVPLADLRKAPIRRDALDAFAKHWEIRRLERLAAEDGVGDEDAGAPAAARPADRRGSAAELRERAAAAVAPAAGVPAPRTAPAEPAFGRPAFAPPAAPLPATLAPSGQGDLFAAAAEAGAAGGPSLEQLAARLHEVRSRSPHGLAIVPVTLPGAPRHAALVGIAVASRDGSAAYLPLAHESGPNFPVEQVRDWLKGALADATSPKVALDLKSAMHTFTAHGLPLAGGALDLHVASFLCDPAREHSIEALAFDALGVALEPIEPPAIRGRSRGGPGVLPVADVARAAERLAAACWPLADALRAQLETREQWPLYRDLEHPLIAVLSAMERAGVALDAGVLHEMSAASAGEIATREARLHELAGGPVNLASGQQLARVLFETLQLPAGKRTKTGYSTDSEVLESLAETHEFPRLLLEWRALTKLKSTYLDALPADVDPADRRIHTTFEQTGAATGRLASSDPNLQNIPMRTPQGRAIRRAFVAAPGNVLVGADYSQIELRVMAHLSGDPALREAFASGEDIHASTARRVFKLTGDVPPELRARAKVVNFGVMYGMGARSLAQQMGLELKEAKEFIDGYFAAYAGVRRFLDRTLDDARERGWVQTLLGRRRYLPQLQGGGGMERSMAERAAINTPIQGSAADLVKLAMLRVHSAFGRSGRVRLLLQVHDELLLECPAGEAGAVAEQVRAEMEGCYHLDVPLTVSVGTGATWYDVH